MKKFIIVMLATFAVLVVFVLLFPPRCRAEDSSVVYDKKHLGDKVLMKTIADNTVGMSIEEIAEYSLRLCDSLLTFSTENELHDLSNVTAGRKTHCVGYSWLYSEICNYAISSNNYDAVCEHRRGAVFFCGVDITCIISSFNWKYKNFFKDHDFNVIVAKEYIIVADPSIWSMWHRYRPIKNNRR